MIAWDDENKVIVLLIDPDTGAWDLTLRTVEIYPAENAYPTGKIVCNQLATLYAYKTASALDPDTHYFIRVARGADISYGKLIAKNSIPMMGAGPA